MNAPLHPKVIHAGQQRNELSERLAREVQGEILFSRGDRGRYATDASIYQADPIGVLVPKTFDDVRTAASICAELRAPFVARGGGTSQCGQTVGPALVLDNSKYLNRVIDFDLEAMTVTVEPGIVLDHLNAWLKPHGVWFPVEIGRAHV